MDLFLRLSQIKISNNAKLYKPFHGKMAKPASHNLILRGT